MLDRYALALLRPAMHAGARGLARLGVTADQASWIGFGIGVERTVLCMPGEPASYAPRIDLFIAAAGPAARIKATALAHQLRTAGVTVEIEHREVGFKAQFRRADKLGARLSLALGESELATGAAKLKDMAARTETPIDLADVVAAVTAALGR